MKALEMLCKCSSNIFSKKRCCFSSFNKKKLLSVMHRWAVWAQHKLYRFSNTALKGQCHEIFLAYFFNVINVCLRSQRLCGNVSA